MAISKDRSRRPEPNAVMRAFVTLPLCGSEVRRFSEATSNDVIAIPMLSPAGLFACTDAFDLEQVANYEQESFVGNSSVLEMWRLLVSCVHGSPPTCFLDLEALVF